MKNYALGFIVSLIFAGAVAAADSVSVPLRLDQSSQSPKPDSTAIASAQSQKKDVDLYPVKSLPIPDSIKVPTLDFKNTDVRDILRALGVQYQINIYMEPDVRGPTSLYLVDVPLKTAIDFIVRRSGFAYTVENKIIKVYKYAAPPPPPPAEPGIEFRVKDGLIDVDIKNLSAQRVAKLFIDSAKMNVIIDGTVDKPVTGYFRGLKAQKAVKVLFETNGFTVTVIDNVYYVALQTWGADQGGKNSSSGGGSGSASGGKGQQRLSISVDKELGVSVEVDNASLDMVIRTIATQGAINIIVYDNIVGTISAKFTNTSVEDAFRFLLQNTKFTFWKTKDIYFVGSREMSQQIVSQIVPLKFIMADEEVLSKQLPPHLVKESVIKYDKEHNAVIVNASYDVAAQMIEFLDKIDKPVPQILIEALVVDFQINKFREYGVQFFTALSGDSVRNLAENYFPAISNFKVEKSTVESVMNEILKYLQINQVLALPQNFMGMINALEGADAAKVQSTPQIATLNGNTASITIGETRYFKLTQNTNYQNDKSLNTITTNEQFEKIQFNNKLEITPWVMADRYVTVKIRPEFNIPRTKSESNIPPSVDTRVLESTVRLKDGQTIVLGGQRQTSTSEVRRSIPFLGDIPVLGWLFSNKKTEKVETQMMIFLTPHIHYNEEGAVNPQDYFQESLGPKKETVKVESKEKKEAKKKFLGIF